MSRSRRLDTALSALLAAVAGTLAVGMTDHRLASRHVHALHASTPAPTTQAASSLVVPLPNDTISPDYWNQVDMILDKFAYLGTSAAGASGVTASGGQGSATSSAVGAAVGSSGASAFGTGAGAGGAVGASAPGLYNGKSFPTADKYANQPYTTFVGAAILKGLSEQNTQSPPPSQDYITQQFIAECPTLAVEDTLTIMGASCGESMGKWVNPSDGRVIVRWDRNRDGSLYFGVDNRNQNGSVAFADLRERVELSGYNYDLTNCKGARRFTIEQQITKVASMGQGDTTMEEYDNKLAEPAYFIEFNLMAPNGTKIAMSTLFRVNSDQVNITATNTELSAGEVIAIATRQGAWKGDGWKTCSSGTSPKGWSMAFQSSQTTFEDPGTVMDLRIAVSAMITLMASLDETRNQKTGLAADGSWTHLWELVLRGLLMATVLLCGLGACTFWQKSQYGRATKKLFFMLESVFMPKRAPKHRSPAYYPAY